MFTWFYGLVQGVGVGFHSSAVCTVPDSVVGGRRSGADAPMAVVIGFGV